MSITKVRICAKHNDMYAATAFLENGNQREHDGYGLYIDGLGGGDYLRITIDNATGKIEGWVPLTEEQLEELFEEE